jgi:hypothetical protein
MKPIARLLPLSMAWLTIGLIAPAAEPIRSEQFDQLYALIKPARGEDQWDRVPWLSSLWQARQIAAAKGKPILLWEMDGHPLGCT